MKTLYETTRATCNEKPRQAPGGIKNKQGDIITDDKGIQTRWKKHFDEVLNRDTPSNPVETENATIPEMETIDTGPASKTEVRNAIRKLKNGKAGRVDMITPELLKADIETPTNCIINDIWDQVKIPHDWKKGLIVKLPKKGDLSAWDNWRGIRLLLTPSKIFCIMILKRIEEEIDAKLWEEQARFR